MVKLQCLPRYFVPSGIRALRQVHRHLENYKEGLEAASRAHKIDQSRASFLCLILATYYANAGIQSEKERFDDLQEGVDRLEDVEAKHPVSGKSYERVM